MKTNQWIRLGLFALATTVVLPAVAQRKRPTKGKVTKVTITQPKAGNYRIDGMAPADANGQWVYLYKPSGQGASDSVQIANGRFTLERAVAEDGLIAHLVIPRSYNLSFIPEEGIIKADLAAIAATGTALNDLHATERPRHARPSRQRQEDDSRLSVQTRNLDDKAKEEAQEKIVNESTARSKPPRRR